jgi:ATP-dependent 26S proteasome regulatory subunit
VLRSRAAFANIGDFKEADYASLCGTFLGSDAAARLDYGKIYRFAPKLNARQLRDACAWVTFKRAVETDPFIDYLREMRMASNVHLGEVARVSFDDLKGIDDILQALEANIILPLENDALAQEMRIKPKRGVLIAGPPGTGKTTIGRALAHRLRGKFFLIDGTFISGTQHFYSRIAEVFEAAKENSPSVIFIDDSDVIFESGEEHGLYRYLLTMLDGLESESNARVCVMMTAMDVGNLPPALIRSGRVELWLETRLPDDAGRAQILSVALAELPGAMGGVDVEPLAQATQGLTGADLRRLVEDGKILYAYDRLRGRDARPATEYFLSAVQSVRVNRERYARAEVTARQQRKHDGRPPWFDVHTSVVSEPPVG